MHIAKTTFCALVGAAALAGTILLTDQGPAETHAPSRQPHKPLTQTPAQAPTLGAAAQADGIVQNAANSVSESIITPTPIARLEGLELASAQVAVEYSVEPEVVTTWALDPSALTALTPGDSLSMPVYNETVEVVVADRSESEGLVLVQGHLDNEDPGYSFNLVIDGETVEGHITTLHDSFRVTTIDGTTYAVGGVGRRVGLH